MAAPRSLQLDRASDHGLGVEVRQQRTTLLVADQEAHERLPRPHVFGALQVAQPPRACPLVPRPLVPRTDAKEPATVSVLAHAPMHATTEVALARKKRRRRRRRPRRRQSVEVLSDDDSFTKGPTLAPLEVVRGVRVGVAAPLGRRSEVHKPAARLVFLGLAVANVGVAVVVDRVVRHVGILGARSPQNPLGFGVLVHKHLLEERRRRWPLLTRGEEADSTPNNTGEAVDGGRGGGGGGRKVPVGQREPARITATEGAAVLGAHHREPLLQVNPQLQRRKVPVVELGREHAVVERVWS